MHVVLPKDNSCGLESDNGPVRSNGVDWSSDKTRLPIMGCQSECIEMLGPRRKACLSCCAKFATGPAEVRIP